jgi:hypothetical protein
LKAILKASVARAIMKRVVVTPRKTFAAWWAALDTGTVFGSRLSSDMIERQVGAGLRRTVKMRRSKNDLPIWRRGDFLNKLNE